MAATKILFPDDDPAIRIVRLVLQASISTESPRVTSGYRAYRGAPSATHYV